jgi:hypothetical protein
MWEALYNPSASLQEAEEVLTHKIPISSPLE